MTPELKSPDKERQIISLIGWLVITIIKAIRQKKEKKSNDQRPTTND